MSYLLTWGSRSHSPVTTVMAHSMAYRKHMPGECMGREQSRIGIIIRLINSSVFHFPSFPQPDDKNMLGNIGDLYVKHMRQVTKSHLYHLFGVSDYYVMYRHRAQSVL